MSQVSPGDDGSSRRSGSQAPKGTPAKRPPAKVTPKSGAGAKGRPPTAGANRPPGGAKGRPQGAGGAKGRAPRPNMPITAAAPRRFSPSTLAFVSIGLVVVIVLVFVVVKVTGSSTPKSNGTVLIAAPVAASPSVLAQVTGVSNSVSNAVGTGSGVTAPSVLKGQPPLTSNGKPEMLFIGAEFCPFCAAERWAMVVALSRFGTWSGLKETTSSLWDADPGTATFTFRDATIPNPYIDLVSIEHETNDTTGANSRKLFQPLTTAQGNLWSKYSTKFGENTGYPFVDIDNKVFVIGPSYDPGILAGLDQPEIAVQLANPRAAVTQAIVGTANYLTAAICSVTGEQPASVCSQSGVHKAAVSMKLS